MTTWRHTEAEAKGIVFPGDVPGGCIRCLWDNAPSPCQSPTPDPASPCGHPTCNQRAIAHVHMGAHGVYGRHPHVPTRCTCGHPIEEATR